MRWNNQVFKIILICMLLTGCGKFDGFDPATSALKWIITKDK